MDAYKVIRREELSVARWSGGTTTQLAIWPEDASYEDRNFTWRVSSARVESEESEFTYLPGVTRCLMVLEGELLLSHEGHYEISMERFSQDNFDGGWRSRSRGKVTDFNLMTTDAEGRVQVVEAVPCSQQLLYLPQPVAEWKMVSEVLYLTSGAIRLELPGEEGLTLDRGDVLIRHCLGEADSSQATICNSAQETAFIVRAVIYHN